MDPAHPNQALSANGAAIGQFHKDIWEIRQELSALRQAIEGLTQLPVSHDGAPQTKASSVADYAVAVAPTCDSYACDPEPFDGNLDRCRGFLLQCRLVFSQQSRLFTSDES